MSDKTGIEPRKKTEVTFDGGEPTRSRRVYTPATDIVDTGSEIIVTADLPGADEHSLEVTLEKDVLTIFAAPPQETVEKYDLSYAEYGVGNFERKFVVSEDIDRERIEARVKNGVLTLRLPKAGPARSRKIEVRAV